MRVGEYRPSVGGHDSDGRPAGLSHRLEAVDRSVLLIIADFSERAPERSDIPARVVDVRTGDVLAEYRMKDIVDCVEGPLLEFLSSDLRSIEKPLRCVIDEHIYFFLYLQIVRIYNEGPSFRVHSLVIGLVATRSELNVDPLFECFVFGLFLVEKNTMVFF